MDSTEDLSARVLLRHILSTEPPMTPITSSDPQGPSNKGQRQSNRQSKKDTQTPQDMLRRSLRQKLRESITTRKSLPATNRRTTSVVPRQHNKSATTSMLFNDGDTPRHILMNILQTEPVKSPVVHEKGASEEPQPPSASSTITRTRSSIELSGLDLPDLTLGNAVSTAKRLTRKRPRRILNVTAFENQLKGGDVDEDQIGNSMEDHSSLSLSSTSLSLKTPFAGVQTEKKGLQRKVSNRRKITEEEFGEAVNKRQMKGVSFALAEKDPAEVTNSEGFTLGLSKLIEPDITADIVHCNTALYAQPDNMTSNFSIVATQDKPTIMASQLQRDMREMEEEEKEEEEQDEKALSEEVEKTEAQTEDADSSHPVEEMEAASQSEEQEMEPDSHTEEEKDEEDVAADSEIKDKTEAASQSEEDDVVPDSQTEEEEEEEADSQSQDAEAESQTEEEKDDEDAVADSEIQDKTEAGSQSEEAPDSQAEEEEEEVDSRSQDAEAESQSNEDENVAVSQNGDDFNGTMDVDEQAPDHQEHVSEHMNRMANAPDVALIMPVTEGSITESSDAKDHTHSNLKIGSHDDSQPHMDLPALPEYVTDVDAAYADYESDKDSFHLPEVMDDSGDDGHKRESPPEEAGPQESSDQEGEWEEEDDDELPLKTPAFVKEKRNFFLPNLSGSPSVFKNVTESSTSEALPAAKPKPVRKRKSASTKKEACLPKNYVMSVFKHFAKTKVSADVYPILSEVMDKFFERLAEDLETYATHAKRKTIDVKDAELLLRRQGYVNNKVPVEVLIEKYLRMDQRQLLIPIATKGNVVIPKKRR